MYVILCSSQHLVDHVVRQPSFADDIHTAIADVRALHCDASIVEGDCNHTDCKHTARRACGTRPVGTRVLQGTHASAQHSGRLS